VRAQGAPVARMVSVPVTYPVGLEDMINAFKLCATARLFIQDLVPDLDAGIFLDNDVLLLRDPAVLWDRFNLFSPFTAMAVAPVEAHYSVDLVFRPNPSAGLPRPTPSPGPPHPQAHPIPYYGLPGLGLNAGVALMNLTRLRELPGGGFTEISRYIWEKYREKLTLADQDVLNLVGAQAPWLFQPLPCEWNYHTWTVRSYGSVLNQMPAGAVRDAADLPDEVGGEEHVPAGRSQGHRPPARELQRLRREQREQWL